MDLDGDLDDFRFDGVDLLDRFKLLKCKWPLDSLNSVFGEFKPKKSCYCRNMYNKTWFWLKAPDNQIVNSRSSVETKSQ